MDVLVVSERLMDATASKLFPVRSRPMAVPSTLAQDTRVSRLALTGEALNMAASVMTNRGSRLSGWHSHVCLASLWSADQQPAQLGAAGGGDGAGHARRLGHAHWRRLRRHRQQHAAVRFLTCYCGVVYDQLLNKTERPGHALNFSNYFFTKLILFTSLLKNEVF